ncbi:HAMP domain-containing histidine kinase [Desulfonatronovibrio magnus]|uniref:HAMP domain-containing histidine kinase n=1 Tax=Desulfonatronovibrio magnus TaxID=698827 RepID=UPI0005EB1946|nr:HAMP domain-containing histidine kinase [Desulfonatronovibrio magnus]
MKLTDEKYMALADFYYMAGLGQMVNGLIHNLNNYVHIMDMQLSMLNAKAESSAAQPLGDFRERLAKSSNSAGKMVQYLQKSSRCSFFGQKDKAQLNIKDFLEWIIEFWENDLFFKHKILCQIKLEKSDINLLISPFYLTLCVDQGIRNAVEACQEQESQDKQTIIIDAAVDGHNLNIETTSFTVVADLDPWLAGSTSKEDHLGMGLPVCAFLAGRQNWKVDMHSSGNETKFKLVIPITAQQ